MFRCFTEHLQNSLFDTVTSLSTARQERLATSWAGEFYHEVFCRLDETLFAPLYADIPSRPNIPVNRLVGIEILKSGYGWSDEELFDHLNFDLQVRYALGVRELESEICTLRTIYNFRRRVSQYMQTTGKDPFAAVFAQITDAQLAALHLDTRQQRMDSTQVGSNIRQYSRLRLVLEVLQRATRMLSAADQEQYAALLQPYVQSNAGQYCYRVTADAYTEHLTQLGQVIAQLLSAWASTYAEDPAYRCLARVFAEHFTLADPPAPTTLTVKTPAELSAASLQSPDDPEATYREKHGRGYRGYVVNVTETCTPDNPLQLITAVQVAPNTTDDQDLLVAALPDLDARMPLSDLHTDGGYVGPAATRAAQAAGVNLHPTAIRGAQPDPEQVGLAEFAWEGDADAPTQVTCPHAQTVPLTPGRVAGRYRAAFAASTCADCPLRERCPAQPRKRQPVRTLLVTQRQIEVAHLRRACAATASGPPHLRPSVEATIRSVKHPFGDERTQLPVRGQRRMTMLLTGVAMMVNLRRIWRYRITERAKTIQETANLAGETLLSRWRQRLHNLWRRLNPAGFSRYAPTWC